jgi:formylglycine-generating enzyme required for sulfatase activity
MVPVCSKEIKVCVDRFELYESQSLKPVGYMNRASCEDACKAQGKRLLKNKEWLLACEGTKPKACNIFRQSPVVRMYRAPEPWIFMGVDCKQGENRWTLTCMNDPRLNEMAEGLAVPGEFKDCVSRFGVYDMVGNLGEWVDEPNGVFNGGLYPMPRSSCQYTTTAHGPGYSDYSIGCRCGMTPALKKRRQNTRSHNKKN